MCVCVLQGDVDPPARAIPKVGNDQEVARSYGRDGGGSWGAQLEFLTYEGRFGE